MRKYIKFFHACKKKNLIRRTSEIHEALSHLTEPTDFTGISMD